MDAIKGEGFSRDKSIEEVITELSDESGLPIPDAIKDLSSKPVLHKDVIEKEDMEAKVRSILLG